MRNHGAAISLALAITVLGASTSRSQQVINSFSDPEGLNCIIADDHVGPITVYIFHWATPGAVALQFRVETGAGFTGFFVSHQVPPGFLDIGTPPDDYVVSYPGCLSGRFLISTLTYFGLGTSEPCSHIWIRPAPTSPIPGEIVVADCNFQYVVGTTSGPAVVNDDGSCWPWCIGPVEPSTWGKVKALYR
jgi:hypothetical protein